MQSEINVDNLSHAGQSNSKCALLNDIQYLANNFVETLYRVRWKNKI